MLVVADVVVEVEVSVEMLNHEVQNAFAEVYARSLVTQGTTATALQVLATALSAGAAEMAGTRRAVARKLTRITIVDEVDGRLRKFLLRSLLLYKNPQNRR